MDNLYKLDLDAFHIKLNETLQVDGYGTKRKLINENFSILWHKHQGHISQVRIERLVSSGVMSYWSP